MASRKKAYYYLQLFPLIKGQKAAAAGGILRGLFYWCYRIFQSWDLMVALCVQSRVIEVMMMSEYFQQLLSSLVLLFWLLRTERGFK